VQVFSDTEERPGEKRIYSIIFDERRERLLTGSSVFDCWPLTRSVQDTMQLPHTHDRPIIAVVYNSYINQIATLCSSDLRVWEAETSRLMYSISEIHGKNIEATSMALDPSGYRLATGGFNGSMKIWDFGAGQELKHKQGRATRDDLSIIKLAYTKINDELYLIAFGWNNKVKMFHVSVEFSISELTEPSLYCNY
jgi:WD repeat-containing protein 64